MDATCAPSNIKYPQDTELLNQGREYLEKLIDTLYSPADGVKPRTYREQAHTDTERIVSLSQPYIRPIVRGKTKAPVEFGVKLDISVVDGFVRLEKQSFEAYNEGEYLQETIERYRSRTGYYPARVLADKIYRNRNNLNDCKGHGIRLTGPALGRPKKDVALDKKQNYLDECERIEVERAFSHAKAKFGMRLIRARLEGTTKTVVALSILSLNLSKMLCALLRHLWIFLKYRLLDGLPQKLLFVQ